MATPDQDRPVPEGRSRWLPGGGANAARVMAILIALGCLLAAAAYATTRSAPPAPKPDEGSRPLRPRIIVHPDPVTSETTATFDFSQPGRPPRRARPGPRLRIECRLDDGSWEPCVGPVTLTGIERGTHRFAVRAVNRAGNEGPVADFVWRRTRAARPAPAPVVPPAAPEGRPAAPPQGGQSVSEGPIKPPAGTPEEHEAPPPGPHFRIEQIGSLGELFPGAPAQTIAVQVENPNPNPIAVTSLQAVIVTDPPDCPAAENFVLTPAVLGPAAPLVVPAESSVSLPEAGVAGPTIAMVDLPVSQDACQAAELGLALTGEAAG